MRAVNQLKKTIPAQLDMLRVFKEGDRQIKLSLVARCCNPLHLVFILGSARQGQCVHSLTLSRMKSCEIHVPEEMGYSCRSVQMVQR